MDTLSIKTYLLLSYTFNFPIQIPIFNLSFFFISLSLSLFMATRIPFTESQWEELENQALVFKYLAANMPVPPHLLFLIKRPFLFSSSSSSSSSSSFFSPTLSPHFGWNVYEMGMGRKIDAEPGRCRRTDGKKWRCSKEAYPDSKYCERHMHRGKNRSSSRKPPPTQFTPNLFLDSSSRRRRSGYMDDFFSIEPSGSIKSCSGSAMEDNDDGSCRGINNEEKQPDRHCFILGTDLRTRERPLMLEEKLKQRDHDNEEEQGSKRFYRFLDEWPSSKSSVSTSLFI
ncbi:growth-regulating factor 6 [Arabidopsis thaliana]|uniref:Growth-regulating factor n=1 Tax=Arabidopsis thaliana TaxID=3702 RepID=A0A1P8B259_ARATH|nr:growth-regulating factor 6 [Arabidopsis thaliana]ANM62994.1 growth-regulating factor 6 [Arabidopsis thaliana]|eukprot:NP_001325112.1 growth-regulating factor 6 [Arabidopsis thaliana]